jgi:hypothetical protein
MEKIKNRFFSTICRQVFFKFYTPDSLNTRSLGPDFRVSGLNPYSFLFPLDFIFYYIFISLY